MEGESEGENWEGEFGWGLGPFPLSPAHLGGKGRPTLPRRGRGQPSPRRSSQTLASLGCPPSHAAQGEGQEADCRRYDEGQEAASNLNRERNRALT